MPEIFSEGHSLHKINSEKEPENDTSETGNIENFSQLYQKLGKTKPKGDKYRIKNKNVVNTDLKASEPETKNNHKNVKSDLGIVVMNMNKEPELSSTETSSAEAILDIRSDLDGCISRNIDKIAPIDKV